MLAQTDTAAPTVPARTSAPLKRGHTEPVAVAQPAKRVREIEDNYVMYADDTLITPQPMPMRVLCKWVQTKDFDTALNAKAHEARLRKIDAVREVLRNFHGSHDGVDFAAHLVDNLKRSDVAGGGLEACVFRILLVKQTLYHQATGVTKLRKELMGVSEPNV